MTPRVSFISKREKASVTVTFTLVFTLIVSILLVTLEHAYVKASQVIAVESLNRSMESVIGDYYAPLYSQYGLLAIPLGAAGYKNKNDFIPKLKDNIAQSLKYGGSNGTVFCPEDINVNVDTIIKYQTDDLQFLALQLKDSVVVDSIVKLGQELSSMDITSFSDLSELLKDKRRQDISFSDEKDMSQDELDLKTLYDDLVAFFDQGIAWYFLEEGFSDSEIDLKDMPSDIIGDHISPFGGYKEPDIDSSSIIDGSYIDELVDENLFNKFLNIVESGIDYVGDDAILSAYASLNMDNYLTDNVEGKLKYEQEYIIFGKESDLENIKATGWTIFAIRMAANIIMILKDESITDVFKSIISEAIAATGVGAAVLTLLSCVLAAENALVETCAIMNGASVDFIPSKDNMSINPAEIFSFSKAYIRQKAQEYKASSKFAMSYSTYLYVFMLLSGRNNVLFHIVDVIDINMKKIYDSDFDILNCCVGFTGNCELSYKPRFVGGRFISYAGGNHKCIAKSAIRMPLGQAGR